MNLRTYLDSLPRGGVKALAASIGVKPSYLCRIASGNRPMTADWALRIQKATDGRLRALELYPPLAEAFVPPVNGESSFRGA